MLCETSKGIPFTTYMYLHVCNNPDKLDYTDKYHRYIFTFGVKIQLNIILDKCPKDTPISQTGQLI